MCVMLAVSKVLPVDSQWILHGDYIYAVILWHEISFKLFIIIIYYEKKHSFKIIFVFLI